METESYLQDLIDSKSNKSESKDPKKDNIGWYAFLFFMFLVSYAFFAFVYFK